MAAIVVQDLRREYGALAAVDGLSFDVAEGEPFALLGPNGAGKTTTVEILTGHRRRTSGHVSVLGFDPQTGGRAYRRRIGVVLQSAGFEEDFTVRELVGLQRSLYPRVHDTDAAGTAVLLVAFGALVNGYRPDPGRLSAAVLAFGAGVACCSALGLALVASLRASRYVPAVALGTLLPLSFISDVFVVGDGGPLPAALRYTADVFPLKHLSRAMLDALGPDGGGGGVAWTHLGVLAVWTLVGVVVAARSRVAGYHGRQRSMT